MYQPHEFTECVPDFDDGVPVDDTAEPWDADTDHIGAYVSRER